jgi:sirohydrochlorin ferrochelatase
MKGIVLVDHGSLRTEATEMMVPVTDLIQSMAGDDVVVRYAHMDLAPPTVAEAFAQCVEAGADDVVVFPYMLSPGRHSTTDIPRMVAEAARAHPGVSYSVTPAFGVHEKLGEVVLERVGIHSTR